MPHNIHVLMEVWEENKWTIVKGENWYLVNRFKKQLEEIESNEIKRIQGIINGKIDSLKENIYKESNHVSWIKIFDFVLLFDLLSNVNGNYRIHSFQNGQKNVDYKNYFQGLSQEADAYFDSPIFKCHTLIQGEDIRVIEKIIARNLKENLLSSFQATFVKTLIQNHFVELIETYNKKGYKNNQIRFLIAYTI